MKKDRKKRTDFLLPHVSFLTGMGSVFSLFGNYYEFNYSKTEKEADLKALKSDWDAIGEDFNRAFEELAIK